MSASEKLRALDKSMTPAGELGWWFDGRDIFHKKPGTNLDQIIIPLGHLISDTYTADGAVSRDDFEAIAALRNALPLITDVVEAAERWDDGCCICSTYPPHAPDCPLVALQEHLEGEE